MTVWPEIASSAFDGSHGLPVSASRPNTSLPPGVGVSAAAVVAAPPPAVVLAPPPAAVVPALLPLSSLPHAAASNPNASSEAPSASAARCRGRTCLNLIVAPSCGATPVAPVGRNVPAAVAHSAAARAVVTSFTCSSRHVSRLVLLRLSRAEIRPTASASPASRRRRSCTATCSLGCRRCRTGCGPSSAEACSSCCRGWTPRARTARSAPCCQV